MVLSKQQKKLITELRVRYDCVIAYTAARPSTDCLPDDQYQDLLKKQFDQEREFFAKKHNISFDELFQMEDAYRQLNDIEERHQFLDYDKICTHGFYEKLREIIQHETHIESCSLAKYLIPFPFRSGCDKQQREISKRLRRCRVALEKSIPRMSVYEYEEIGYVLIYDLDHGRLEQKEYEKTFIKRLCERALQSWYVDSIWFYIDRLLH